MKSKWPVRENLDFIEVHKIKSDLLQILSSRNKKQFILISYSLLYERTS